MDNRPTSLLPPLAIVWKHIIVSLIVHLACRLRYPINAHYPAKQGDNPSMRIPTGRQTWLGWPKDNWFRPCFFFQSEVTLKHAFHSYYSSVFPGNSMTELGCHKLAAMKLLASAVILALTILAVQAHEFAGSDYYIEGPHDQQRKRQQVCDKEVASFLQNSMSAAQGLTTMVCQCSEEE